MKRKEKHAAIVIQMPELFHLAQGKFWFFLPVPFLYHKFPFEAGDTLLVTVTKAKGSYKFKRRKK